MTGVQLRVFPGPEEVAQAALDLWLEAYAGRQQTLLVSLAGGTTPKLLYQRLAQQQRDWSGLHLLWGDERWVPHDHEQSNCGMVKSAWLDQASSLGPIWPWPILETPAASALAYEQQLRQLGRGPDLCLLGLGDDGHTASLFPESPALDEQDRWAVSNWVEKFSSHRLTLTYPYLNSSRQVVFLVTGASKAVALQQVLQEGRHPAAKVRGTQSTLFLVDEASCPNHLGVAL